MLMICAFTVYDGSLHDFTLTTNSKIFSFFIQFIQLQPAFNRSFTNPVSLRALPPTPLCTCGCLAYYYGLSGRWSLNELDTEMSSWL